MRPYTIIDTHAHICDEVFDTDRAEVLQRAKDAFVTSVVAVAETLADAEKNLQLAKDFPMLMPAAGLYPAHIDLEQAEAMERFIRQNRSCLYAIGEVGLDYWIVKEEADMVVQREIFSRFIDLAMELDLPLNVHSRSAGPQAVKLLLEKGAARVQLHAFDGKAASAMPAVHAGYFFSIPPSIVRSRQKQKLVKQLPLSCLIVETDSPVLGPSAREQRNEPSNAVVSVQAIAEIKDLPMEKVMEAVLNNTCQLLNINKKLL